MSLAAGLATLGNASRPAKVENLSIKAPLAVEESKSTQLQTLAEFTKSSTGQTKPNELEIKIYHKANSEMRNTWLLHSTATFSPHGETQSTAVGFERSQFLKVLAHPGDTEAISRLYKKLANRGLKFGSLFQSLEALWKADPHTLVTKVKVPSGKEANTCPYFVHPVVLDAMMQSIVMLKMSDKLKKKIPIPIKIGTFVWLGNGKRESEERYVYVYDSAPSENATIEHCVAYLVDSQGTLLAVMSHVECINTTAHAVEFTLETQTSSMIDLWEEVWRPTPGLLQLAHNPSICGKDKYLPGPDNTAFHEKFNKFTQRQTETLASLKTVAYLNILRYFYESGFTPAMNTILNESILSSQFQVGRGFARLFSYFFTVLEEEGIVENVGQGNWKLVQIPPPLSQIQRKLDSTSLKDELILQFRSTSLIRKVGDNLRAILTEKLSPLTILFPKNNEATMREWSSAGDFYVDYYSFFNLNILNEHSLRQVLTCCKSKHESEEKFVLRICEIGAGTGVFSKILLAILTEFQMEFHYDYTDISSAFFTDAEKRFEKHVENISFRKLNIEEDPISQGFKPAFYDLVVASDVVHATRSLKETLGHINMLLKPAGSFVMLEQSRVNRVITLAFGVLDGFWRFEDVDVRTNHCILSTSEWKRELEKADLQVQVVNSVIENSHINCWTKKRVEPTVRTPKPGFRKLWLLFHEPDSPMSNFLLRNIPALTNRKVICIQPGETLEIMDNIGSVTLNALCEKDFADLLQDFKKCDLEGVIYGWSLNDTKQNQDALLQPFFWLAKAISRLEQCSDLKLITLFKGVVPAGGNPTSNVHPSTLWGFLKTFQNEQDNVSCAAIDIGLMETEDEFMQVFYELWHPAKATQVAYQGTTRLSPKLCKMKSTFTDLALPAETDTFCLVLPETKAIADLKFATLEPFDLQKEEIEIQVKACALNFQDVLSVLKPTADFEHMNSVGIDFAGVVKRTGPAVTKWSTGDRVFGLGFANKALPSHLKLHQDDVIRIPKNFTFNEASTLPAVVATSYHCLIQIAQVTSGNSVLIHTASGGVGLSAIQICQHLGATIFATAGSTRKQNYLRNLGVHHVFHSRNTDYEQKILQATNGRGVDVVLNSLTHPGFKEATLRACAKGAVFVEMSKLNVWQPEGVQELRPDVNYIKVDLFRMTRPELTALMAGVENLLNEKIVQPLPYVRFDGVHIRDALQHMQKAKHIGKVVCVLPDVRQEENRMAIFTPMFHENASYLITGGLGGIGFAVCKWMLCLGARYILLAGRSLPSTKNLNQIERLNREYGAMVCSVQLDISNFEQCKQLLEVTLGQMEYPGLRGVMHAAGTMDSALVKNHTWSSFSSTLATKVKGTMNLHELTKSNSQLEHFVLFSTVTCMLGTRGLSNHSAGCYFEDTFAHYRNSLGLPATSVNWGLWGEVGVATDLEMSGLKPFSTLQGTSALDYALKTQQVQMGAFKIDSFDLLAKEFPNLPTYLDERLKPTSGYNPSSPSMTSQEFWDKYYCLENFDGKLAMLKQNIRLAVHQVLRMDVTDVVNDNDDFETMGVDSLMFVEITNALQTFLGDKLLIGGALVRDFNTVEVLADALLNLIEGIKVGDDAVATTEAVNKLVATDDELP